jgi:hypothetical protein
MRDSHDTHHSPSGSEDRRHAGAWRPHALARCRSYTPLHLCNLCNLRLSDRALFNDDGRRGGPDASLDAQRERPRRPVGVP